MPSYHNNHEKSFFWAYSQTVLESSQRAPNKESAPTSESGNFPEKLREQGRDTVRCETEVPGRISGPWLVSMFVQANVNIIYTAFLWGIP